MYCVLSCPVQSSPVPVAGVWNPVLTLEPPPRGVAAADSAGDMPWVTVRERWEVGISQSQRLGEGWGVWCVGGVGCVVLIMIRVVIKSRGCVSERSRGCASNQVVALAVVQVVCCAVESSRNHPPVGVGMVMFSSLCVG